MDIEIQKEKRIGHFFLLLFAVLIIGGIVHKRVFHAPEFMMFWHLPAAIFLVLGGKKMTRANRARFYQHKQ